MSTYAPTFADLQRLVREKIRLDVDDDADKIKASLNNASNLVATEFQYLSGLVTPSALNPGDTSVELDSTLIELNYLTSGYGGQTLVLGQLTLDRLLMLRQQPNVAGPPIAYSLQQTTVELWPAALGGELLSFYGTLLPDEMTGDSDAQPYPEPYGSNLLVYGAAAELAEFTKDILLLGTFQQKYAEWSARFTAFLIKRQGNLPKQMIVEDGTHGFFPHDRSSDWDLIGPRPNF